MTEEIKTKGKFKLTDDELDIVTGGQDAQEGWTVVLPYSTCGNWGEKVNGRGESVGRFRGTSDGQVEQKCSTCKHYTYLSPNHYCTLGS